MAHANRRELVLIGCDHQIVAPSELSGLGGDAQAVLIRAQKDGEIDGAVLIRTCNRVELLIDVEEASVAGRLAEASFGVRLPWRVERGALVVRRMLRIATGLESMVPGEPQILGQVSRAFNEAEDKGLLSRSLHKMRTRLLSTARSLRNEVWSGGATTSVAGLGAELAVEAGARIGVLGAGETGQLVLELLQRRGVERPLVINRTLSRAEALARHFHGEAIDLPAFLDRGTDLDALVCAIDTPTPILGPSQVERIGRVVDLSRPSVCSPGLADLGFEVFDLDALASIAESRSTQNREGIQALSTHVEAKFERLYDQVLEDRAYLGNVVELHVESALSEVEQALRGTLKHLSEEDRDLLRGLTSRLAKRHAHYHILDLKQLGVTP